MPRCFSCGNGRGCCDFSSKAKQLPSLASIDVVEGLLTQVLRNTARRQMQLSEGELDAADIVEANHKVIHWLTETFCGNNAHYRSDEAWNPDGLAVYLREMLEEPLQKYTGEVPEFDKDVIAAASEIFLADVYRLIDSLNVSLDGLENSDPGRKLTHFWALLLTGAPMAE